MKLSRFRFIFVTAILLLLVLLPGNVLANGVNPGDIVINEYVANSGVTEWVELYNTTGTTFDISGYYIDDIASGGGSPKAIPASTTLAPGGFYVMEFASFLNNGGDDVRFLDPTQTTVIDSTSYSSSTAEYSWYRVTDGGTWSGIETDTPTKNATNGGGGGTAGIGDVVINEFVANSAVTEWVELYNTTGSTFDLSGYYIDDINAGGGSPKVIPNGTTIAPGGYVTVDFTGLLNNGGDDVRFLDPAQTELDAHTYGSSTAEYSWYRYPDGGNWAGIESDAPTKGATNTGIGDTPWTPGTFEIRIFDVEQGDSQLIIFPSGYTILIDVTEHGWNSGNGAALIAAKIQAITGGTNIDVGILSHHHLDHIGYAGYGGFWGLIENEGITFGKLVDRNAGIWVDGHGGGAVDGLCDPNLEIQWLNAGTVSGTGRNWLCYATDPNSTIYGIREIAQVGSTTQIDPPDAGAVVEIVQADAQGIMMSDGITPLQGDHTGMSTPPSENDYSIGVKIRYGTIDYATSGDSDGEYATSQFGYTYNDVETDLADRFGQVDVMRANHHGSGHSSNQYYVDTLNPDVSAISCGNNSFGHPAQAVLDRLNATGDVYVTNLCDTTRNYGAALLLDGDIILQSSNGLNYTVNGTSYLASDPVGAGNIFYISTVNSATLGGTTYNDEDIVAYDADADTWTMFFDGSDVDLGSEDVDAFAFLTDGSILLSLDKDTTVTGLGAVDDADILKFTPSSTGDNTAGTLTMYFDGSDVGFDTSSEDVDAIAVLPDNRIAMSTRGNYSVPGLSGNDEDLIIFNATTWGDVTAGTFEIHFDGSDVDLTTNTEDTSGAWVDASGNIYLSFNGAFSVSGVTGDEMDILQCTLGSTGTNTACSFSLYFDGSLNGLTGEVLDGIFRP